MNDAEPRAMPLLDICEGKHQGNTQSRDAFRRLADALPAARLRVMEYIAAQEEQGATAQECANALGVAIHKVSGRFSELKRDGLIVKIGVRDHGGVCVAIQFATSSNVEDEAHAA